VTCAGKLRPGGTSQVGGIKAASLPISGVWDRMGGLVRWCSDLVQFRFWNVGGDLGR